MGNASDPEEEDPPMPEAIRASTVVRHSPLPSQLSDKVVIVHSSTTPSRRPRDRRHRHRPPRRRRGGASALLNPSDRFLLCRSRTVGVQLVNVNSESFDVEQQFPVNASMTGFDHSQAFEGTDEVRRRRRIGQHHRTPQWHNRPPVHGFCTGHYRGRGCCTYLGRSPRQDSRCVAISRLGDIAVIGVLKDRSESEKMRDEEEYQRKMWMGLTSGISRRNPNTGNFGLVKMVAIHEAHEPGDAIVSLGVLEYCIVSAGFEGSVRLWSGDTGTCAVGGFLDTPSRIASMRCVSFLNSFGVSGGSPGDEYDCALRMYQLQRPEDHPSLFGGHTMPVADMDFNILKHCIVSASDDRTLRLWDYRLDSEDDMNLSLGEHFPSSLLAVDENRVFCGTRSGLVLVRDIRRSDPREDETLLLGDSGCPVMMCYVGEDTVAMGVVSSREVSFYNTQTGSRKTADLGSGGLANMCFVSDECDPKFASTETLMKHKDDMDRVAFLIESQLRWNDFFPTRSIRIGYQSELWMSVWV